MTGAKIALLPDRAMVSVTGDDASAFLQGLITNDMGELGLTRPLYAALLTPQGKILFDFLVSQEAGGLALDVARDKCADLVKRLQMYRLRAKVEIADRSATHGVVAAWNVPPGLHLMTAAYYTDPRLEALGQRGHYLFGDEDAVLGVPGIDRASAADYHAHRISLGVPEGGKDYAFGDTFPHEALLDQLNGVSFSKGCFVGQEVVARMEHRGAARKRVVPVVAETALPQPGTEIMAGGVVIGTLGSVDGPRGLALMRLDRAAELAASGMQIRAGVTPLEIKLASWARFALTPVPS